MISSEVFESIVRTVGVLTYGKERWFHEGNDIWYDRNLCRNITNGELETEVEKALSEMAKDAGYI